MTVYASTRNISLIPAEVAHMESLLADIRQVDRQEWLAWTGLPLRPCLKWCIENSLAFTAQHRDGGSLAIIGAQDFDDPVGSGLLWFAATNRGYSFLPEFTHLTTEGLKVLHAKYPHLVAYTDARNAIHHIWLDRTGWRFTDDIEVGKHPTHSFLRVERNA